MPLPEVSVIIPTYNRKWYLLETLRSIALQSFPAERFEVIVVDDGSIDSAQDVLSERFPYKLQYIYQMNQGDAEARNKGALQSKADLLVFLDDDILIEENYLDAIVSGHQNADDRIVVGTEFLWVAEENPLESESRTDNLLIGNQESVSIEFTKVCSNNMSVKREAFLSLGMMESLDFPGSSIWCDVDFSYRAHLEGFKFCCNPAAICWHRDYVTRNLDNQSSRWREAAFRAAPLFQKRPGLVQYLPMFEDKTPINWQKDPARLISRKLARRAASSKPVMWTLEAIEDLLENMDAGHDITLILQRWIIGGYIYQGYQDGQKEISKAKSQRYHDSVTTGY